MRIMGLDYGDKTIGIAVSDILGVTAQSKGTIRRTSLQADLGLLNKYIVTYQIKEIVVGLPRNMNGSLGARAQKTEQFVNFLKKRIDLPINYWDERLSSAEAERLLINAELNRDKRKKVVDQVAAAIILQGYLDFVQKTKKRKGEMNMTEEGSFWIDEEEGVLVIKDENGEERFIIDDELYLDEHRYLVLVPEELAEDEESEALLLKVIVDGEEEILANIEDDDEFERVREAYLNE